MRYGPTCSGCDTRHDARDCPHRDYVLSKTAGRTRPLRKGNGQFNGSVAQPGPAPTPISAPLPAVTVPAPAGSTADAVLDVLNDLPGITVVDPVTCPLPERTAAHVAVMVKGGRRQEAATDKQLRYLTVLVARHTAEPLEQFLTSPHARAILGGVGQFDNGQWATAATLTKTQASLLLDVFAQFEADQAVS